jgi:predicted permease
MLDPASLYRKLLRIYPARFREEYQAPMERQFRDDYRDAASTGQRARVWWHAIADLLASAPSEIVRELNQDLRYAVRVYRTRPLSAALALAALALSIGAVTGVFSVLHALLLRGLPFSDPSSLVEITGAPAGPHNGRESFYDWWRNSSYLQSAATFSASEMNLNGDRDALRVKVAETSSNFFTVLGTNAAFGRTFAADEDVPGRAGVAVISYALWQQAFGSNPSALGKALHLNGVPVTIIGVARPRFDYPARTALWISTAFNFQLVPKRGAFLHQVIGRLKAGITLAQAQGQATVIPIRDQIAGQVRTAAWVLAGIVAFVLIAACANLAQLLLSRTTERYPEIALRSALGASRARLVQQLMTEAVALTMTGAAGGLLVAYWISRLAVQVMPAPLSGQEYRILDWPVLLFAASLALLTGFLFGVIPASLIGRLQPSTHIVRGQAGAPPSNRMRSTLIAVQTAITLMLLAASLTMGRTFLHLLDADLGFRPANVVTATVSVQGSRHKSGSAQWRYYSELLSRLRAIPGVEAASAVGYLPLANNVYMAGAIKLDSGQSVERVVLNGAMPGYFHASGTTLLAGRDFTMTEGQGSEPAVIVNQAFAQQAGVMGNLVGRKLIAPWTKQPYVIAGVVATARLAGPAHAGTPQVYWPVQEEPSATLTFVARVNGDVEPYLTICRDALQSVDRHVPVYDVRTLDQRLDEVLARPRFFVTATIFLACVAVIIAVAGIYGSLSFSLAQRRHEMGVRMALGASSLGVRSLIVRQSLVPIVAGIAAGLYCSWLSGHYMKHLIDGVEGQGIEYGVLAAILLILTAIVAAWRATASLLSLDPLEALRAE